MKRPWWMWGLLLTLGIDAARGAEPGPGGLIDWAVLDLPSAAEQLNLGQAPQLELDPSPPPPLAAPVSRSDFFSASDPLKLPDAEALPVLNSDDSALNVMGLFQVQGYVWERREDALGRWYLHSSMPRGRGDDSPFSEQALQREQGWSSSPWGPQRQVGVQILLTVPPSSP